MARKVAPRRGCSTRKSPKKNAKKKRTQSRKGWAGDFDVSGAFKIV